MSHLLICEYCDNKWEENYYWKSKDIKCPKCNDKNIKAIKLENRDIFGYDYKEKEDE